jgi:hypothetical protein
VFVIEPSDAVMQEWLNRLKDVDLRESASRRPSVSSLVGWLVLFSQCKS